MRLERVLEKTPEEIGPRLFAIVDILSTGISHAACTWYMILAINIGASKCGHYYTPTLYAHSDSYNQLNKQNHKSSCHKQLDSGNKHDNIGLLY